MGNGKGPIPADRLRSFIERIERLEEERQAIGSDIRDVYSEAKGVGYDVKTMRKVVSLRKMDAADRDEQEALLDTYWHALTTIDRVEARVASGESVRKAAAAEGMPKSTAIRQVTQNLTNVGNGSDSETAPAEGAASNVLRVAEDGSADLAAGGHGSLPKNGTEESQPVAKRPNVPTRPENIKADCNPALETPPTESLGAVAKPEAERVATTGSDDLKFPIFLTKAGQRALPPHKEK